jgi:pyruvate kinase
MVCDLFFSYCSICNFTFPLQESFALLGLPTLVKLMKAGMNIARLNFSHGSYESHTKTGNKVREAAKQAGKLIALALDTKGPEIRTGTRAGYIPGTPAIDIEYTAGTKVKVSSNPADINRCDETLIAVDYKNLPKVVELGGKVFLDDGLLQLEIIEIGSDYVMTKCLLLETTRVSICLSQGTPIPPFFFPSSFFSFKCRWICPPFPSVMQMT